MKILSKLLKIFVFLGLLMGVFGVLAALGGYYYLEPKLPSVDSLRDVKLQVPLRVYSRDKKLIWEFGEQRRSPVDIENVPEFVKQAFIAAEDDRFYDHPGVDVKGLAAAVYELVMTGKKKRGGSTITMQVARNYFLTREKSYIRKLNEILLALKIEREISKDEVLELYLNKIYLGHRSYGVAAAAQVYYGVELKDLKLHQAAMIAGLPKAPSTTNPVTNPGKAEGRRSYVLGRMRKLNYITEEAYQQAMNTPDDAELHDPPVELDAPYIAEMVRAEMVSRFGEAAYADGYQVYTRIESKLQQAADHSLRKALLEYVRRHGYRGPEAKLELSEGSDRVRIEQALRPFKTLGDLPAAVVLSVEDKAVKVYAKGLGPLTLDWKGLSWARPYISETRRGPKPKKASDILAAGDVIRIESYQVTIKPKKNKDPKAEKELPSIEQRWRLAELPEVEGALAAMDPKDGGIRALVGGFDFRKSKFNRAVQAKRQAGSSFKPFIYTAALVKGFTPATVINDAPVVFEDRALEGTWRPENYSGKIFGPTRLREALIRSRNLVSIRLLRKIGIPYAVDFLANIGFPRDALPRNLTLSLGSASVSPLRLVTSFASLANGGYKVDSWLIERVDDARGNVLYRVDPATVCKSCKSVEGQPAVLTPEGHPVAPRVIPAEDAYLMYTIMREVITRGTGRRALKLKRKDLAGKTGTTNDQQDAWFSGFNGDIVASAWVGFDQIRSLGSRETGGKAALPIWVGFMETALKDTPDSSLKSPPGIVRVRINPETGKGARPGDASAIFELFRTGTVPDVGKTGGSPRDVMSGPADSPSGGSTAPSGAGSAPPATEIF